MKEPEDGLTPLSPTQMELLEEATSRYEKGACSHPGVRAYLANHGLEESDAVSARLGVATEPIPGHEQMQGRLAIPYLDRWGAPLAIKFRCLQNHSCKEASCARYIQTSGQKARIFNAPKAILGDPLSNDPPSNELHIAEGEIEVIALAKAGYAAVGLPGADAWKPHYRRLFSQFERVYLWGDPDQAGSKFNATLLKALPQARIIPLALGDVCETLALEGVKGLHDLVEGVTK